MFDINGINENWYFLALFPLVVWGLYRVFYGRRKLLAVPRPNKVPYNKDTYRKKI